MDNKILKQRIVWAAAIFVVLIAGLMGFISLYSGRKLTEQSVVATLNGNPITYGEFCFFFPRQRALVASQMYQLYGMTDSPEFWETVLPDGTTPIELAKQGTMEEVKRAKARQLLFLEYGIADNITYQYFHQIWLDENMRREKAYETGQVIYGPGEYEEGDYFAYLQDSCSNELKKLLARDGKENRTPEELTDELLESAKMIMNEKIYHMISPR